MPRTRVITPTVQAASPTAGSGRKDVPLGTVPRMWRDLIGDLEADEVFVWDHETDSRRWVAPSLETYLRWWIGGDLKL